MRRGQERHSRCTESRSRRPRMPGGAPASTRRASRITPPWQTTSTGSCATPAISVDRRRRRGRPARRSDSPPGKRNAGEPSAEAREPLGLVGLDVGEQAAGPVADVGLDEALVDAAARGRAARRRSSPSRARARSGLHHSSPDARRPPAPRRARAPARGRARSSGRVAVALEAPRGVVVGLPVAGEEDAVDAHRWRLAGALSAPMTTTTGVVAAGDARSWAIGWIWPRARRGACRSRAPRRPRRSL